MKHLKPDINITTKIIKKDHTMMILFCLSIIFLAVYAYLNDFSRVGIYVVIGIVAFLFLGTPIDIPNETWTSSQKASWTKKYTTLKIEKDELIYVLGNSPKDRKVFLISEINTINYKNKKLILTFINGKRYAINAKYWHPIDIKKFIDEFNLFKNM